MFTDFREREREEGQEGGKEGGQGIRPTTLMKLQPTEPPGQDPCDSYQ